MNIGVALSGGGIKSYAQLPILKAMDDVGLEIDCVSGTSMGSAIAALVAAGVPVDEMYDLALAIEEEMVKEKIFIKPSVKIFPFAKERIQGGYVDGQILEDIFVEILKDYDVDHISDVKIPIAIPSVDLITGKVVVFVSHPEKFKLHKNWDIVTDISLAKAVRASCSFPFVIAAMPWDNYHLVDGGIKMNLPSMLLQAYDTKKIIAVTMTSEAKFEDIDSLLSTGNRVYDLMVESYDELMEEHVDLMINVPVGDIWVFELGKGKDVINEGETIAKEHRDALYKLKEKPSLLEDLFG